MRLNAFQSNTLTQSSLRFSSSSGKWTDPEFQKQLNSIPPDAELTDADVVELGRDLREMGDEIGIDTKDVARLIQETEKK